MSGPILVLLGHAQQQHALAFEQALRPIVDADVCAFAVNGLSSAYDQLAKSLKHEGRILPSLFTLAKAPRVGRYEHVFLVTWSAAYKLVERLFAIPDDAAELSGWVALDSGYGVPPPQIVELARLATAGKKLYFAGYTDVPTSYPSTGAYLGSVKNRFGSDQGLFHVEHWAHDAAALHAAPDKSAFWREEHIRALVERGPRITADAVRAQLGQDQLPDTQPSGQPPEVEQTSPSSFGRAVLAIAEEDLEAGVREVGHNDGPEIRRLYLDPLHLPPGSNWCAAAVRSWIVRAAERLQVAAPAIGSPAAKTQIAQFQRCATWIPAKDLKPEMVEPGMIFVEDRSVPGAPETSWWGHTGVVAGPVEGGRYPTIEGNSGNLGNKVASMNRDLASPRLLGMGRFR